MYTAVGGDVKRFRRHSPRGLPEADEAYKPVFSARKSLRTSRRMGLRGTGADVPALLRWYADDIFGYGRYRLAALLLWGWIAREAQGGIHVNAVQGPPELRRHPRPLPMRPLSPVSAHRITKVLFLRPSEDAIEELLKRFEIGLPREALPLLRAARPAHSWRLSRLISVRGFRCPTRSRL